MERFAFVIFLSVGILLRTIAAQVEWDTIRLIHSSGPDSPTVEFVAPHVDLCMYMELATFDGGVEITAKSFSIYMEYANAFVGAQTGDIVDDLYVDTNPKRFSYAQFSDRYGENLHADYSIVLKEGVTEFLAFRNETMFGDTTFGWIELGLGEDGTAKVVKSAWDMDGDPITVGATPEPSGALLLLVGGALLALRRRA